MCLSGAVSIDKFCSGVAHADRRNEQQDAASGGGKAGEVACCASHQANSRESGDAPGEVMEDVRPVLVGLEGSLRHEGLYRLLVGPTCADCDRCAYGEQYRQHNNDAPVAAGCLATADSPENDGGCHRQRHSQNDGKMDEHRVQWQIHVQFLSVRMRPMRIRFPDKLPDLPGHRYPTNDAGAYIRSIVPPNALESVHMPDANGHEMSGTPGATFNLSLILLLVAIAATGLADLILDRPDTWYSLHTLFEILFLLLCLTTAAWLGRGWLQARRSVVDLRCSRDQHLVERDAWRRRAQGFLKGLGEEIDGQMTTWQLTPTERQTALLLLKGYSHKQIADYTERSERTVRQHAVAVYRKSGLGGRAELSAFFLEDLLLPDNPENAETVD